MPRRRPQPDARLTELREARVRTRLLREQLAERRLKRAVELQESHAGWVEPYVELLTRIRQTDWEFHGPSTRHDRLHGRNFPIYQTEQELSLLRAPSRLLMATNSYAQGLAAGIASYVFGPKTDVRFASDDEPVQAAVQQVLERVWALNEWHGGQETSLERELFERRLEDGEWFLRHTAREDGLTDFRVIDADQVTTPPGADWREWSFGVYADPADPHRPEAWWVAFGETANDGQECGPDEITYCKRNVKRGMKRGVPDYAFGAYELLRLAAILLENLGEGAAERAAIVGVRQHAGATVDQVQSFVDGDADYQRLDSFTRALDNVSRKKKGRWEDMPDGMQYVPGPGSQNVVGELQILQAALRGSCRKWQPPEGLISGDSSNNNFASSLTAESPFVRAILAEQGQTKPIYARLGTVALLNWCKRHGGLEVRTPDGTGVARTLTFAEVMRLGKVEAEFPSPETRDHLQEAQRYSLENQAGVTSVQTWQQQIGRDPEKEEQNFAEYKEAHPEMLGNPLGLPGQDGAPGQAGEDDDPGRGSERKPEPVRESVAEPPVSTPEPLVEAKDAAGHDHAADGKFGSGGGGGRATGDGKVRRLWGKVKASVASQYHELADFYGRPAAAAIVAVAALPVPGSVAAPIAARLLAKAVRHVQARHAAAGLHEAAEGRPDLDKLAGAVRRVVARACEITGEPVPEFDAEAVKAALAERFGGEVRESVQPPPRRTVRRVERNADGFITQITDEVD